MHPRSPYRAFVDFRKLAEECPGLAKFVDRDSNINFRDPDAVRELAKSLLKRDFGLEVALPEDRLCPMIPNRLDYVLWIEDLIDSTTHDLSLSNTFGSGESTFPAVTGMDIGTGASCIYPLLGCAQRFSWSFIGTDIDVESLKSAQSIIRSNFAKVGDRIRLYESQRDGPLFPLDELEIETVDFTMCNPPFYTSIDAMFESAKSKALPPASACTGTTTEMVYSPSGEVGFANRMLQESLVLRTRVGWYTTLFSRPSSVHAMVESLRQVPDIAGNWAITEFIQGTTKRWAVGWSFRDRRPARHVAVCKVPALKGCSPFPPEVQFAVERNAAAIGKEVQMLLDELETLNRKSGQTPIEFYAEVRGDMWSRAARRAKTRGEIWRGGNDIKLGLSITVAGNSSVAVQWKRGSNKVLFESFSLMLKKKLSGVAK